MTYIKRAVENTIAQVSKMFPVLLVTGPRQVGKTTLLQRMAEAQQSEGIERKYVTLDDPDCILSIGNPQNCHQNSLFLEREFLVFVRTRFLHSEVLSGASMHAASDNFSRRT